MIFQGLVGANRYTTGTNAVPRLGKDGESVVELNGRNYENVYNGRVFTAYALMTAPVIYTTAAGTGGPLIWNGSSTVNVVLLAVGFATSVVTTVATGLGITGGVGQAAAPSTTTAIDAGPRNCFIGGALPLATAYRLGTTANAGNFFLPYAQVHTGALTVDTTGMTWIPLEGMIICPPQAWVSVGSAGATATTLQVQVAAVWAEVPV